mgnify:CR=1 FL=1
MGTVFFIGKSGSQSWDCSSDFDGMAVDNRGDSIVGIDVSQKNQTPILEKSSLALSGDCDLWIHYPWGLFILFSPPCPSRGSLYHCDPSPDSDLRDLDSIWF